MGIVASEASRQFSVESAHFSKAERRPQEQGDQNMNVNQRKKIARAMAVLLALVVLVAAAPSTDSAGNLVLAFGPGDAYTIQIRDEFLLGTSAGNHFDYNATIFRAIARVHCEMADATSFTILKLHA